MRGLPAALPGDGEVLHGGTQGHLRLHRPAADVPQIALRAGGRWWSSTSGATDAGGHLHASDGDDQQLLAAALPPRGGLPGVPGRGHEVQRPRGRGDPGAALRDPAPRVLRHDRQSFTYELAAPCLGLHPEGKG